MKNFMFDLQNGTILKRMGEEAEIVDVSDDSGREIESMGDVVAMMEHLELGIEKYKTTLLLSWLENIYSYDAADAPLFAYLLAVIRELTIADLHRLFNCQDMLQNMKNINGGLFLFSPVRGTGVAAIKREDNFDIEIILSQGWQILLGLKAKKIEEVSSLVFFLMAALLKIYEEKDELNDVLANINELEVKGLEDIIILYNMEDDQNKEKIKQLLKEVLDDDPIQLDKEGICSWVLCYEGTDFVYVVKDAKTLFYHVNKNSALVTYNSNKIYIRALVPNRYALKDALPRVINLLAID